MSFYVDDKGLARISHKTLGNLETSVSPNIPKSSLGNGYNHAHLVYVLILKVDIVK